MVGMHLVHALMLSSAIKKIFSDVNFAPMVLLWHSWCFLWQQFSQLVALIYFMFAFSGSGDQALLVEESIKHAKEAVMLDIKDGNSWCKSLIVLNIVAHVLCSYTTSSYLLIISMVLHFSHCYILSFLIKYSKVRLTRK